MQLRLCLSSNIIRFFWVINCFRDSVSQSPFKMMLNRPFSFFSKLTTEGIAKLQLMISFSMAIASGLSSLTFPQSNQAKNHRNKTSCFLWKKHKKAKGAELRS
jgi:hypothetical protein